MSSTRNGACHILTDFLARKQMSTPIVSLGNCRAPSSAPFEFTVSVGPREPQGALAFSPRTDSGAERIENHAEGRASPTLGHVRPAWLVGRALALIPDSWRKDTVVVHQTRPEQTPGGPRPVEHKDAARRQDILRAATKLFAEQGYRETNLNQIAVELGFRRQAVYHYFPAKDEILYELIAQAGEAMISTSQPIFDADLEPDAALTEIVRNHVRVVLAQPDTFRVQFAELNKLSGPRAEVLRKGMSGYVHRVADVIDAGQRTGLFVTARPMTQALLLVGMCNGTTQWFDGARSTGSIDELADQAACIALSGLTGRPVTKPSKSARKPSRSHATGRRPRT